MRKIFTDGWKFWKAPYGTAYEEALEHTDEFKEVCIPHDWLIGDAQSFYADNTGWYQKDFEIRETSAVTELIFEGIYMDSSVYINGVKVGEWKNGYTQFILDVTGYVKTGKNTLFVQVNYRCPNSRWYSGAGIYRNVYFVTYDNAAYIPENGIYVHSEKKSGGYEIYTKTEVKGAATKAGENASSSDTARTSDTEPDVIFSLSDKEGKEITLSETDTKRTLKDNTLLIEKTYFAENVREWSTKEPVLYKLSASLNIAPYTVQKKEIAIGFRNIEFTPDKGMFLNGNHLKLQGVCIHHDLGSLGAAYSSFAMKRRLMQLKEMGVNAIRLSHNVYDSDVLDKADEMGFLVISEAFDMWEMSKTEYDYARFFEKWHARDLESWIKRDRNHPCVFMWSIGNEIYDTHASERGAELTIHLSDLVREYDTCKNALITSASNYMPWENAQKCAEHLAIVGYNYAENIYEKHHKEHPDWIIYGSETYSIVQSRGIYHFPLSENILSDDDLQCSSLGNSTTSWGAESMEYCICKDRDFDFSLGQFIWTGYDYIGEPTPYHTKNSYFGVIDTAGFYKDAFYVWKSAWVSPEDEPFVHVFPYWDYNEGEVVDVRIASNAPYVELFVNGKSLGRQQLARGKGTGYHIIGDYKAVYEKGELLAVAIDEDGKEIARDVKRSFGDACRLEIKENVIGDLLFAEFTAVDKDGVPVENANNYARVDVSCGHLIGLDNGDSTDYDSYKGSRKRLFGGKLLAIVKCEAAIAPKLTAHLEKADIPRNIKLYSEKGTKLNADTAVTKVIAKVLPSELSDKKLLFRALTLKGTDTNIANVDTSDNSSDSFNESEIGTEHNTCIVSAVADGNFILRCEFRDDKDVVKTISTLNYEVTGIGTAYLDPYDFISGSAYSSFEGKVAAGNEHGVATDRVDETTITYDNIDFGKTGSDEITIPIFALSDDEVPIEIYSEKELLLSAVYHKKSIWNVYQEETFKLSRRLKGITSISIKVKQKIHIKGFSFKKEYSAWVTNNALDADEVYGDTFTKTKDAVEGIGNNVTLLFRDIDFGQDKGNKVVIEGRAPKGTNTIHLRMKNEEGTELKEILEFEKCSEYEKKIFEINEKEGKWDVSFIFLPGSNFDFKSFVFSQDLRSAPAL